MSERMPEPLAHLLPRLAAPADFLIKAGEVRFIKAGRSGRYEGKAEPYLTRRAVTRRLDEVLNGAWKSTLVQIAGDVPIVQCRLSVLSAEGWIERSDLGAGTTATGDGWKQAATDSLKRAARLFGVGAFLDGAALWLPCSGRLRRNPQFIEWIADPRPAIEARIEPAVFVSPSPALAKVAIEVADVHRAATELRFEWSDVIELADSLFSEADPRKLSPAQMEKLIAAMSQRRAA